MVVSSILQLSLIVDPWSLLISGEKEKSPPLINDKVKVTERKPIKALAGKIATGTWQAGQPEQKWSLYVTSFCSPICEDETSLSSSDGISDTRSKQKKE